MDKQNLRSSHWHRLYFYRQSDCQPFQVFVAYTAVKGAGLGFGPALVSQMVLPSLPVVVIGFAGIINEMLDRALLKYLLPYDPQTNMKMLGIYSACYKLSILMSLFIQAFRYAAEPFFFLPIPAIAMRVTFTLKCLSFL